jgi:hypothetical protein
MLYLLYHLMKGNPMNIKQHSDIMLNETGSLVLKVTEHEDFVTVSITVTDESGNRLGTHTYFANSASQLGGLVEMLKANA